MSLLLASGNASGVLKIGDAHAEISGSIRLGVSRRHPILFRGIGHRDSMKLKIWSGHI